MTDAAWWMLLTSGCLILACAAALAGCWWLMTWAADWEHRRPCARCRHRSGAHLRLSDGRGVCEGDCPCPAPVSRRSRIERAWHGVAHTAAGLALAARIGARR